MIRYLFLAGCLLLSILLKAQTPTAAFTASTRSGCGPLGVSFTDKSTGDPKFWNWEVSNGADVQLSTLQNPSFNLATTGFYTVKLVVRNADGTNGITETDYINVFPSPASGFIADKTEACLPAVISFSDLSSSTAGTITSWEWVFGDGGTSTQQNPVHIYSDNGFYTVSLKVTSSTGCPGSSAAGRYIRVVSGVKPAFAPSVAPSCLPPFNTTFSNQTTGPGTLSYIWRFSDGTTSTDADPVKSYNTPGTFNVKLVALSNLGCSDSIEAPVTINGANIQFTAPTGACTNTLLTFINTSAANPVSTLWDFGDGTQSTDFSPSKAYTNAGTYSVSLTEVYAGCSNTVTQSVLVSGPPAVDFTADVTAACKAPQNVNFTSIAPGAVKWAWSFGDGSTSAIQDPPHTYSSTGEFNVSLTITNANNCTATVTNNAFVKITPPVISLQTVAELCTDAIYEPAAGYIAVNSPDPVTSYTWNWGDNTGNGTGLNATHVYATEGSYTVTLTVATAGNCSVTTSFPNAVLSGDPLAPDFIADKLQVCDKKDVQFTNITPLPGGDKFLWTFSDGSTSTDENPAHAFSGGGAYSVTLKVRNKGCYTTITKTDYITVLPPTAKFDYKLVSCNDPYTYNFTSTSDTSIPASSSYSWQFGTEGTSADINPTFKFLDLKSYPVTLTVTDNTNLCSSSITQDIVVFQETATLSSDKSVYCKNEIVHLTANVGQPQNIDSYQWTINGGMPVTKSTASWDTSFAANAIYILTAILTDNNGCTITQNTPLSIQVQGPEAHINISSDKACRNTDISFTDESIAAAGIKGWNWDFGDGSTANTGNPSHAYRDSGSYTVKFTVTDNNGCPDVLEYTDTIKIRQPMAAFKAGSTLFCKGGSLQFIDTSKGYGLTYEWSFGDGKTSADQDPVQIYDGNDGKYTVTLKVTDDAGCPDEISKTDYIEIKSPKPAFSVSDSISLCRLFETKFTFAGTDYESFFWDFGDEATTTTKDPTHFYNEYGNYTAKLYLKGYGGCLDSAEQTIQVIPASASMVSYTAPPFQCQELNVDFTLIPPPSVSFQFSFGDGAIDTSKNLMLSHIYNTLGTWTPGLVMTDKQGCQSTAYGQPSVRIIGAFPFFGQDKKAFCDAGDVAFTQFIVNNDPPVVSYVWDFGDGAAPVADQNAIHSYNTPGTYITSLTVTTANCPANTLYDTVRVYRTPVPVIGSDDIVCISDRLTLEGLLEVADTATLWNWNAANITDTSRKISVKYSDTGRYTIKLEATNLLGCKGDTSKTITVKPLPEIRILSNPVIPVRTDVTLPVTYSSNVVSYTWTPDKDLSCNDCATPVASPQFTTKYTVAVVDEFGCKSEKDITVNVICNELNYFVPNTFSPNGDGSNDVFYPRGKGLQNIVSLRIFNRWGEQVFERRNFPSNDPTAGWNGLFKGKTATAEVYVYILEVICDNGQVIPLKGNVTLLR